MGKKNKDIELTLDEGTIVVDNQKVKSYTLMMGKKQLGEIIEISEKKYQAKSSNDDIAVLRSLDDAIEELIRIWNLEQ